MSGYVAALNETKIKEMGLTAMIMKPVTLDALDLILQDVLCKAQLSPLQSV